MHTMSKKFRNASKRVSRKIYHGYLWIGMHTSLGNSSTPMFSSCHIHSSRSSVLEARPRIDMSINEPFCSALFDILALLEEWLFSWRQVNHILNIFLPMSHSRLDSRRSNYLDAVHSCRISLATSNWFTYSIQQGHSVYPIHVQQKKLVYGHIKTYGTVKKSHHRRVKSHPSSSYTFPTSGGA